jgi:hypothetical protein
MATAINGVVHSWDSVAIKIMGKRIGGIERIDYDITEDDPEPVLNQGSREVVGMGFGSRQLSDVTVEMREDAYQEFEGPARDAGKTVLDYWPFPIVISYADHVKDGDFIKLQASAIHTDTLDQCKVSSVSKPNKQGDKKITRTLTIKARAVV